MTRIMKFDVSYINPLGNPGTFMEFPCESVEEVVRLTPFWLAASSQWSPEQFKVVSVKLSSNQEVDKDDHRLRISKEMKEGSRELR